MKTSYHANNAILKAIKISHSANTAILTNVHLPNDL